jgi:dipeptidyl aminopeptidase/acylaminoacyl peptidase
MARPLRPLAALLLLSSLVFAQTPAKPAVIAPGDNLVVEGVPPVPASLAEAAHRYGEIRLAAFRSWHPSRLEMLVVTRFADTYQVHQVKAPGGARTQLTFFPENIYSARYQPTTGDYFIYSKDKGGDEFYQIYRYDFATGDSTLLTDGKSRNTGPRFSNKGDRLVYGSTRRNGNDVDLWMVEPMNPKSDRLLTELKGGGWAAVDWSPDDQQILVMEEVSINETYLWLLDAQTGKMTLITPKGAEKISYLNAAFSKDGKGLYVTTDKDSEFQRLAYLDLATGQHTFLTSHLKYDVDEFDLSHDGNTIAFVTNENGMSVLHLLDTRTRKEIPAPKLPVGLISDLRWHKNNHDLAFDMESSRSNVDPYSLDVRTGKVERWTTSETGGLNTSSWAEPQLIQWTSFDSLKITGFLYRPPARFTGKRPVVIDIHGGPEGEFRPGFVGRNNYYLNELGVAMIYPNVRGSSGFGKSFLKLDNGLLRENTYKDIDALLDWIKQQPDLDGDRIMITGGSYGGHMTLAVATFYSLKIRCAVDVVGISNLATFLENTSGYRRDLRRVEYGDERDPKMRAYLEKIAPMNNAEMIKKPLFVIQGFNDPRVPRSEAEQMVATVRKVGTPVWYLMAKDEGHGFGKKNNRDFQFYSTVLFMKDYLLK